MMIHKDLTPERWFNSLFEQLANVGTDIDRAIRWRNKGELEDSKLAFARAMELLDLTIADPKNQGPRFRELKIVRLALVDYFQGSNEYSSTDQAWHNYFYDFNYAAAIAKGK